MRDTATIMTKKAKDFMQSWPNDKGAHQEGRRQVVMGFYTTHNSDHKQKARQPISCRSTC
jgi:hypothetical protein